ncbi:MAG: alpha/beta hydrolase [Anaerolineales bacterium]
MTFILIHGSWHNGSAWYKVENILRQRGTSVYAPTLSGMGAGDHPAGKHIGLHAHIQDIVHLIRDNQLQEVILVGHSYSGLVITGVAERMPDKISKLVFLDAFIPEDNQSLFDILGPESEAGMRATLVSGEGKSLEEGAEEVWLLPPGDVAFYLGDDADEEDVAWLTARLVYTPVLTFKEKVRVQNPAARDIPKYFIRCTGFPYLAAYEEKARQLGWEVFQTHTGHDAMLTQPQALAEILLKIAAG